MVKYVYHTLLFYRITMFERLGEIMKIFCTDLDNTLIYSYKHDIGECKRNVEIYQGREISFITEKEYKLLSDIKDKILILPTTTRTSEQYERIDLGIGTFPYAMTCNGGILLENGMENREWYEESLKLVSESKKVMENALTLLETDKRRTFELRFIRDLFVFTKCEEPETVVKDLQAQLDCSLVDVFNNGIKVYVVPKALSKGNAIRRIKKYLNADQIIAAGDSEFDVSMLNEADIAIAPKSLSEKCTLKQEAVIMPEQDVFGEELLSYIWNLVV